MPTSEALNTYLSSLKAGQKCYRDCVMKGTYPYPYVLDDILDEEFVAGRLELGVIDIPIERIVGTKTAGRQNAFAANFMPLLPAESEFGMKWINLCNANLSETGIHDPIRCYEYLGRFYVQEGNKRVSVMKSFGAPLIAGNVTRIVPSWSEDEDIRLYYEFMDFYRLSRLYLVQLSRPGSYRKLQAALGFDSDHEWSEDERRSVISAFSAFRRALGSAAARELQDKEGDLFLLCLQVFSLAELKAMTMPQLSAAIAKILPDAKAQNAENPIDVSTEPESGGGKSILTKLIGAVLQPSHLNIAFIHPRPAAESHWVAAHEEGRQYLEEVFDEKITVRVYNGSSDADPSALFDEAAADGAQMIFATAPTLISACRKAAATYPDIKILNCSVSMPFPGVRTYYSRIYEGKFIYGAIAGAMTKTGRVGYIGSNPIYGVPAGINAFALGARLTNPEVEVLLRWSCVDSDPVGELKRLGCDLISNRDIPTAVQDPTNYGLCRVEADGSLTPIGSPVWNWGEFYVHMVQSVFSGAWEALNDKTPRAVNYWWGLSSGVVDIVPAEAVPQSMTELGDILKRGIIAGVISPFCRRITTQSGRLINDGSRYLSADEILHIDWLCDFVEGSIPGFDELLPMSRPLVRLQGIYRDTIPPEKDEIQI